MLSRFDNNMKIIFTLIIIALLASPSWGADCLAVRKKISKERDLLAKRELTKQGLKDCPNDAVINFNYAYSMERLRKYDKALKYYKIATKLDPKYAKAFFGLGDVHSHLKQPGKAVQAYKKGMKLDPNNKRYKKYLQAAKKKAKKAGINIAAPVAPVAPPAPALAEAPKPAGQKSAPALAPPAKKAVASKAPATPFVAKKAVLFQKGQNQLPIIAQPQRGEKMQTISFKGLQKQDATGLSTDKKLLVN